LISIYEAITDLLWVHLPKTAQKLSETSKVCSIQAYTTGMADKLKISQKWWFCNFLLGC